MLLFFCSAEPPCSSPPSTICHCFRTFCAVDFTEKKKDPESCLNNNILFMLELHVGFGRCICSASPHVKCISSRLIAVFMFSAGVCTLAVDRNVEEIYISCSGRLWMDVVRMWRRRTAKTQGTSLWSALNVVFVGRCLCVIYLWVSVGIYGCCNCYYW